MSDMIFPEDRTPKAWKRSQQTDDYESASFAARSAGVALVLGLAGGILICVVAFVVAMAVYP